MATTSTNKVVFGLSNVHYAIWDETQSKYNTPKPLKGAVKLSITAEGETKKFYADNIPYAIFDINNGYTGECEIAYADDEVFTELLGNVKDSNGLLLERMDAKPVEFALLYEVASNKNDDRFVFYNCVFSRPDAENNTKSDSVDPATTTLKFTATSRQFTYGDETVDFVKGRIQKPTTGSATAYAGFYDEVLVPNKASV